MARRLPFRVRRSSGKAFLPQMGLPRLLQAGVITSQILETVDVLKKILILSFLLGSGAAFAQVAPSVQGGNSTLWVGGEFSSFNWTTLPTSDFWESAFWWTTT